MAAMFDTRGQDQRELPSLRPHAEDLALATNAEALPQITSDPPPPEVATNARTELLLSEASAPTSSSSVPVSGYRTRSTSRALVPDQVFLVWAILALFMVIGLVGLATFYIYLQGHHIFSLPVDLGSQGNGTRGRV